MVVLFVVVAGTLAGLTLTESSPASAANPVNNADADRLAGALLGTPLSPRELPAGFTATGTQFYSFQSSGLVAYISNPLSGPAAGQQIDYLVFDNQDDASSYYGLPLPVPAGYKRTGPFSAVGVADPISCNTSEAQGLTEWASGCGVLSGKVVTYTYVFTTTDNLKMSSGLATALAQRAVRHLAEVASKTSGLAVPAPPGPLSAQMLFSQIQSQDLIDAVLPAGVTMSSLGVQTEAFGSGPPAGLVGPNLWVKAFLQHSPDQQANVAFYVFGSPSEAEAWFGNGTNIRPEESGKLSTATNEPIDYPGFSQDIHCNTYSLPKEGISACQILWGDVVLISQTWVTTNTKQGDNKYTVLLARSGVLALTKLMDGP